MPRNRAKCGAPHLELGQFESQLTTGRMPPRSALKRVRCPGRDRFATRPRPRVALAVVGAAVQPGSNCEDSAVIVGLGWQTEFREDAADVGFDGFLVE